MPQRRDLQSTLGQRGLKAPSPNEAPISEHGKIFHTLTPLLLCSLIYHHSPKVGDTIVCESEYAINPVPWHAVTYLEIFPWPTSPSQNSTLCYQASFFVSLQVDEFLKTRTQMQGQQHLPCSQVSFVQPHDFRLWILNFPGYSGKQFLLQEM